MASEGARGLAGRISELGSRVAGASRMSGIVATLLVDARRRSPSRSLSSTDAALVFVAQSIVDNGHRARRAA